MRQPHPPARVPLHVVARRALQSSCPRLRCCSCCWLCPSETRTGGGAVRHVQQLAPHQDLQASRRQPAVPPPPPRGPRARAEGVPRVHAEWPLLAWHAVQVRPRTRRCPSGGRSRRRSGCRSGCRSRFIVASSCCCPQSQCCCCASRPHGGRRSARFLACRLAAAWQARSIGQGQRRR